PLRLLLGVVGTLGPHWTGPPFVFCLPPRWPAEAGLAARSPDPPPSLPWVGAGPAAGFFSSLVEGFCMSISIRIPDHLAYGDGEPWPDRPAPMAIDDAVYRVVHDAPGGVAGLAARMGVPASTLTHKANPNNATHHMR